MSTAEPFTDEKLALKDVYVNVYPSLSSDIVVRPLVTKDIRKTAKTWFDAFLDDPMLEYVNCDEPQKENQQIIFVSSLFGLWQHTKVAFTANYGEAVAIATPSERNAVHRGLDAILNGFWESVFKLGHLGSSEKKKRKREVRDKVKVAVEEAIGDSGKDMWYVELVCTNPKSQGHGYGSAVLHEITSQLDKVEKVAWLFSSNIKNEPFYNFHGFYSAKDFYLGDDNPLWKRKPVKAQLMIRHPQPGQQSCPAKIEA